MQLSIHDYDKLDWVNDINISLATFGHTKYIKVDVDGKVILYTLDMKVSAPVVFSPIKVRQINSFVERNRDEILSRLSERYGQTLVPSRVPKSFITTDKDVLGVEQMKHQLRFCLGLDTIDFYYDSITKKYHIYVGDKGYCEAYEDTLELTSNEYVSEKYYRILSGLLSYMVIHLRNSECVDLSICNKGYNKIFVGLRSKQLDMRWTIEDTNSIDATYFGIISDENYADFNKAVTGFADMVFETGLYGLIEEVNRL